MIEGLCVQSTVHSKQQSYVVFDWLLFNYAIKKLISFYINISQKTCSFVSRLNILD